ncbi:MAG: 23S rRNA (pseudouridine(1915)-N(3))-methyltransferase RlmH [Bacilli bacterium]|jgi:23S rRNA (pseudouridine1915-N3)-methyltransferase
MTIRILAVGKIKESFWRDAIAEYIKRLSAFTKVEIVEVDDEKAPRDASEKEELLIKEKEGHKLLQKISNKEYVIALTLKENQLDSLGFSRFLSRCLIDGGSSICFVIGGSLGLSESILGRANKKISLSELTFTHQMTRVILLEQIYRSFKVLNNETYHK